MLQGNGTCTDEIIEKKSSTKKKILWGVAIYFAIQAIINIIIGIKKHKAKKREASNEARELKEYYSYMDGRKIEVKDEKFRGMIIKQVMSGIDIDLSEAEFDEDSFITLNSLMSGLSIKVPEHVNVKVDGRKIMSAVSNTVPEYLDESTPTLYIAIKSVMSGLSVRVKEDEQ